MRPFSAASAFLPQQAFDKMVHCKWNIYKALTVNIVHWKVNKSHGLDAPVQNNTMFGQQKLSLLDSVFLDVFS
jgi:hypothetical protein